MHYKQIISFFLQFDTNQLWGINILNFEVLLAYLLVWFSDMIPLSFRFKSYTLVGQCLVDLMKQFLASLSSWGSCVFLSSSSELGGPMTLFFGRRRNLKIWLQRRIRKQYLRIWIIDSTFVNSFMRMSAQHFACFAFWTPLYYGGDVLSSGCSWALTRVFLFQLYINCN